MNIEIGQIEIQGQKYPCELNMAGLEEFLEREGKQLSDIGEYLGTGQSVSKMIKLLHFMLEYGHRVMGKELSITVDQLAVVVGFDVEFVANHIMKSMPNEAKDDSEKKPKSSKTKT